MRMLRLAVPLALLFGLAAAEVRAQAGLLVPTSTGVPDPKVLSLREMTIDVGLARGYARVNVRQVFENHTAAVQEGTYRFALPASAAVGDFAVWDDLVRIPGVILEKRRARAIYRELTQQRIDPGLLQQGEEEDREAGSSSAGRPSAAAVFSVSVAPIPQLGTKRLELQFQQEVPYIGGQGEFRLALAPPDGEPPVAASLRVRVRLEDGASVPVTGGLPLTAEAAGLRFDGTAVRLDRDLIVRLRPRAAEPLRLAAFRNPDGTLPDGIALAPWERSSDVPPEKDGFFLLEAMPPAGVTSTRAPAGGAPRPAPRAPVSLAILFDTSLSHRWSGLETAYGQLVRALQALTPQDRFVIVPFDAKPAVGGAAVKVASADATAAALLALRQRPLAPGTDVPQAVAAARKLVGEGGRLLLLTDGEGPLASRALAEVRGPLPLFTSVSAGEAGEALRAASTLVLAPTASSLETDLFFERLLGPLETAPPPRKVTGAEQPFTVTGGDAKLRDVYPVLVQPVATGSLSGWIGRYAAPQEHLRWEMPSPFFSGGSASVEAGLPEKATDARDLPRRWARARVDDLLQRIEAEGERREWVDEIIALSKRYKFVTPYTAFLAAPRSLLRPRRIQPGDPVLRVECDEGTRAATAFLPFGLRLPLRRRPGTRIWEGRFLVPEGLKDGRYEARILLRDVSGARVTETKHFVLDGTAPEIRPELPPAVRVGETVQIAARTDADVVFLSARLGDGPPLPLRWDGTARRSVARLVVPASLLGRQEVLFEAVDGAKNHAFARTVLEVRP
jgi:Ca-activated chloride channel homolog